MLLSEAFNLYIEREIDQKGGADKTRRNYLTSRNSVLAAIGDIPITILSLDHVARWNDYERGLGHQNTTIKSNQGTLRCVLRFLKKNGRNVLDYRDIELPSISRRHYEVLDNSEVQSLIDAIDVPRDKAIIACLFSTGCRISELLNLNRDDIVNGWAVVYNSKTAKQREVYFNDQALALLKNYLKSRRDKLPPLFVSGQYRRITVSRVEQIVHVATALAGIDKVVTPHVFRHSNITDYLSRGAPLAHVKDIAGHASIKTTSDIYGHIQPRVIKDTILQYQR